ncbi:hypothetical protein H4R35_002282 [Dimargaris xerosporica]|nr:hypothetical protein H4R35_002282 [Dimargaris xerosporica]
MSCTPFCAQNFWDLTCKHKSCTVCHQGSGCGCACSCVKIELDKAVVAKPPTPKPETKPKTPPKASSKPEPNPKCVYVVPVEEPKGPPSPSFDVNDTAICYKVTMKWDAPTVPAKCEVKVENHKTLLIKAFFPTGKKDSFDVFERTVSLPPYIIPEKTQAKYKDGVLMIEVPKFEGWKKYYL